MRDLGPNDACWCGSGKKYKKCHMHRDHLSGLSRAGGIATARRLVRKGIVSPRRAVPDHIAKPEYALSGQPAKDGRISNIKGPEQIARMRTACRLAREVLEEVVAAAKPGITTDALDVIAHEACLRRGCYPSPLNYLGFPKSICTSVNEVICHGIPDSRPLEDGDILNIDVTVYVDGMHGDNSAMVLIGEVDEEGRRLVDITRQCLHAGIAVVRPGGKVNEIGRAITALASANGYSVVTAFVGHGIGEFFHMPPHVGHHYDPKNTYVLKPGMTFTIEPMINLGVYSHSLWDDDWTAVTSDLQRSAQWEHTVLVTDSGVEVLTA